MRPSSSASEPLGLFDGVLARGAVRVALADTAWLAAMLEVESALARVQARLGLVPADAAAAIERACETAGFTVAEIAEAAAASGNPVIPLVRRLRSATGPDGASFVHNGATSQDILDTAAMLVSRRALGPLRADLVGAADAAATLARLHRDTPMAGRTLLRQAVPTTFGLKAAGWMVGLDEATDRVDTVRSTRLAVQFGGPAGTLSGLGDPAVQVPARLAGELGLAEPVLPWHTNRTRPAELACALGEVAGVIAKVARDVTLLAQDEIGEVAEGAPGGSSAMGHKRNPVAAVSAAACAAQAPGLVATLLAAMAQEHERAAGSWHAEWRPYRDLLVATGSAAAWLRDCLDHLRVDSARMRANLDNLLRLIAAAPTGAAAGTATALTGAAGTGAAGQLVDRALAGRARPEES